jgi:glycosyltransferase involved in cell wall biosynthesis
MPFAFTSDDPPVPAPDRIGVVIPSYRVKRQIMGVIERVGAEVSKIYVVDDCCPDQSGAHVEAACRDPRMQVIYHSQQRGVGGATITGYRQALEDGMTVIVKIDGDGQMDPQLLSYFVEPILLGEADYTKGNRFYHLEGLRSMPFIRLFGNSVLSFLSKLSSGYWLNFDPTNGYTAIHASVLRALPLNKIHQRYFFESDMLFRLNLLRAQVVDIPMMAVYDGEESNLSIRRITIQFISGHFANILKRVFYVYFLRDFSFASVELIAGAMLVLFGVLFGALSWYQSWITGIRASSGTVMLSGLPLILGIQFLLGFLSYDIAAQPRSAVHPHLAKFRSKSKAAPRGVAEQSARKT